MIALVLFGLWIARGHLRAVFRKAFRGDPSVDDSGEILSYRTAVWGVILGLAVMILWLWRAGLPLWAGPLFLFGALVTFVSLTRIIAEAGLPMVFPRNIPLDFAVSGIGVRYLGPAGMAALGPDGDMDRIAGEHDDGAHRHGVEAERRDRPPEALAAAGYRSRHRRIRGQHLLDVAVDHLPRGRRERRPLRRRSARLHLGVRGAAGRRERGAELAGLAHPAVRGGGDGGPSVPEPPLPVVAAAPSRIRRQHGPG